MNSRDIEQPPHKKRRFFQTEDESCVQLNDRESNAPFFDHAGSSENVHPPPSGRTSIDIDVTETVKTNEFNSTFDAELFSSVVGQPVSEKTILELRHRTGDDLEKAVNLYLDGLAEGYGDELNDIPEASTALEPDSAPKTEYTNPGRVSHDSTTVGNGEPITITEIPEYRYVGAFGVGGWATRSSMAPLKFGEEVKIQRTRIQIPPKGGKPKRVVGNSKTDVITRFTNANGTEIGRLPQETATWVSTLIDQKICKFTATCVFAPERIRINDTIYLQVMCYALKSAFDKGAFTPSLGDDAPRLFEHEETTEEKALRLRQVALVTLFDEICLRPTSLNETTAKDRKNGILRAAELAEQSTKQGKPTTDHSNDADDVSESETSESLDQDQLDTLYHKAQCFDFNMPEAIPSDTFNLDLRKYQRQALHWLITKEKDENSSRQKSMHPLWEEYAWPVKDVDDELLQQIRGREYFYVNPYSGELSLEFPVQDQSCLGGILADEMGLGKTIEMMSLVHSHKSSIMPSNSSVPASAVHNLAQKLSENFQAPHTTLVVAPTSLLSQWESEASKASKPGSMKTLVYYGTDKSVNLRSLCSPRNSAAPNLIITSYGVVRSEYSQIRSDRSNVGNDGLFSVEYFRVILDEAHYIKNRASKTAKACYEIKAKHRWVLTGTPIVNRLEDLYSLVRFLKVEPWCNFSFWKTFITVPFESKDFTRALSVVQTVLEPLVLRRTKTMKTPEGEALVPLPSRTITVEEIELSEQEREIYDVIFTRAKRTFNDNIAAGTLLKSYTTIFAQILRLRQTCCHPVLTRNQSIVAEEEDAAIAADEMNILKDNMDLQELIDKFSASAQPGEEADPTANFTTHALKQIQAETSGECPICSEEPMIAPAVTSCWHSACKHCLESYIKHQSDKGEVPRCFNCREQLNSRDIFEVVRHEALTRAIATESSPSSDPSHPLGIRISLRRINPLSPSAKTSAKIYALINHLKRLPKGTKAVVFSQFTSFLDLISPQLTEAGITHLRFDGTMSQKARATVLAQFNTPYLDEEDIEDDDDIATPPHPFGASRTKLKPKKDRAASASVLLISLRAGGVGLNLTVANHVFMMDPWWSFAVEAQAIDRVHRMGQLRDVKVSRFVVKDSIEGRILKVQERKMMIAGSLGLRVGGDGSDEDKREQRIEELKLLFE